MQAQRIKSVKCLNKQKTLDFKVKHKDHNFYAEGIVVSNSHSAGYSYLTAICAYLKANHTTEFFLACLENMKYSNNPVLEEIAAIHSELPYFGIKFLPPHLLKSDIGFKIEGKDIRFGLGSIKNIAEKSIEKLNKFISRYSNKFEIFQAADESGISISILSSLILVGALDEDLSKEPRSKVLLEAQLWNLLTEREQKLMKEYGKRFNYNLINTLRYVSKEVKTSTGKPQIKESRLITLRKDFAEYQAMYEFNKRNDNYAKYWFEQKLLGFSYSATLREIFNKEEGDLISVKEVTESLPDQEVRFVAHVIEVKEWTAKSEKKTKCFKCNAKDETGQVEVLIFNDAIEACEESNGRKIQEDDIIVVKGTKKDGAVFARKIGIQTSEVFLKISEMKKIQKSSKSLSINKTPIAK